MRIAIFPTGWAGIRLYEILNEMENIEIEAFVDNNPNKLGLDNYGIKTVSPWKLKKLVKEKIDVVLVASNRMISYSLDELINQLDELEINNYKIIPTRFFRKMELNEKDLQELKTIIFSSPYKIINQLQHLQFHVMDNCNLNCKRC